MRTAVALVSDFGEVSGIGARACPQLSQEIAAATIVQNRVPLFRSARQERADASVRVAVGGQFHVRTGPTSSGGHVQIPQKGGILTIEGSRSYFEVGRQ
jgi:hypothetical protein